MRSEILLVQLRPKLDLPIENCTPVESFQNATLRPILKMLHDALVARLRHYFDKRNIQFETLPEEQKPLVVEKCVRGDQHFRQSLAGMVIGHFTAAELDFFLKNESELMRRTSDLVLQRLQSDY